MNAMVMKHQDYRCKIFNETKNGAKYGVYARPKKCENLHFKKQQGNKYKPVTNYQTCNANKCANNPQVGIETPTMVGIETPTMADNIAA